MDYKELNKQYWVQLLWARGYFAASTGNITDEIIKQYIETQDLEENRRTDNFTVTDTDRL
jgi:putative transposase